MNIATIPAFAGPIVLVAGMYIFNKWFEGWKTNTQGVLLALIGGIQTMDWTFIPTEVSSALMTGSGVAVLMASGLTKRVKTSAGPGYDDPGE